MEQEEPTMEEILASIRKILSGEENTSTPQEIEEPIVLNTQEKETVSSSQSFSAPKEFEPKEKELPPIVAEPAPNAETQRITFTESANTNVITLTPDMLVVPEEVFEEKEEVLSPELPQKEETTNHNISSEKSEPIKQAQLGASEKPALESGNDALTNLMAELLKPALKDWMNKNMTQVLEKLVQEELKNKNLS